MKQWANKVWISDDYIQIKDSKPYPGQTKIIKCKIRIL